MSINLNKGAAEMLVLLGVIVIGAFFLVGGFTGGFKESPQKDYIPPPNIKDIKCCDTGSGDECRVQVPEKPAITYRNQQYGLLKSNVRLAEGGFHLAADTTGATFQGNPIVLNAGDGMRSGTCGPEIDDPIVGNDACTTIPNEQIIYVCKENCGTTTNCTGVSSFFCYGDASTVYDVYFRVDDEIPDVIKNCKVDNVKPAKTSLGQSIILPTTKKEDSLQLNTFNVTEEKSGYVSPWLSPYCKPAIYLYPPTQTNVSVQVNPVGPFTYTTPLYTKGGWNIIASPDGTIRSNNKDFPYLYYEADIPSLLIPKPTTGYSVSRQTMQSFLRNLLPSLGLNEKETTEMTSYWIEALPQSPYYFVGIIPESVLNSIAPLSISPAPQTTIRVSLYFEPLQDESKTQPPFLAPQERNGFTVVEWGGIVKTDKPFTCLQ